MFRPRERMKSDADFLRVMRAGRAFHGQLVRIKYAGEAPACITVVYDKVRQIVTSKSKSKKHGPITGSDQVGSGLIRACNWSILSALPFARDISTHFVTPSTRFGRA